MLKYEPFRLCFFFLFFLFPILYFGCHKKKYIKRQTNIHILRRTYSKEIKSKYERFELLFNVVYFDATRDSLVEEVREFAARQTTKSETHFFRERTYGKRMFHTNENIYFYFNQKPTHSMFITFFCSSFHWAFNFQTQRFFFHEVRGEKYYRWNATKNQVSWIKVLSYDSKFIRELRFCSINIMYIYLLQCTKFCFFSSLSSSSFGMKLLCKIFNIRTP